LKELNHECAQLSLKVIFINILLFREVQVACKRRSYANSGAWLRRFEDATGVVKTDIFR